jgi:hypothetical protein
MSAVLHLHEPVKQGEEIHFEVVRLRPGKCRPLMRDLAAEEFIFRSTNLLVTRQVNYTIVLPEGFEAIHEPIGKQHPDVNLAVLSHSDKEGRRVFDWSAEPVPPDTAVGIRLELSKPTP